MSIETQDQQLLSKEAYLAFNKIGGQIQQRSLEILRKHMAANNTQVASRCDVQQAYWEACQEILDHKQ